MIKVKRLSCFLSAAAIAITGAACAHDAVPDHSMGDPMGNPVNIGPFIVTHAELVAEVQRLGPLAAQCRRLQEEGVDIAEIAYALEPPSYRRYPESTYAAMGVANCGGVEWRAATNLARARCEEMSAEMAVHGWAFPSVTAPASYADSDHHNTYHINDGDGRLHGFCVFLTPVGVIENSTN